MPREWLTIQQVASRYDIPVTTVRWHCREANGWFHKGRSAGFTANGLSVLRTGRRGGVVLYTIRSDYAERLAAHIKGDTK